jgi:hypothetical protein
MQSSLTIGQPLCFGCETQVNFLGMGMSMEKMNLLVVTQNSFWPETDGFKRRPPESF